MIYFNSLIMLISQLNYGGRITDVKDMELNRSLLGFFMNKDSVKGGHRFVDQLSYRSPESTKFEHVLTHIETFPDQDQPEIFGLDQNAILNFQKKQALYLFYSANF